MTLIIHIFSFIFQKLFIFLISQETTSAVEEGGEFVLIAMVIWIISVFIIQWRISKYVLRLMNKTSKTTATDQPDILKESEIKAKNKPSFENLNKDSDTDMAIQRREKFVKSAYLLFRKKYFYGLFSVLGYLALPFGLLTLSGHSLSEESLSANLVLIIFYFLLINFNFYFYRKQFRPSDANFGMRLELPVITLLRKIVNPTLEAYLTFAVVFFVFIFGIDEVGLLGPDPETQLHDGNLMFGIGLILASLLHVFAFFRIRHLAQKTPNQTLLILRVFGDTKQTALTFGKITSFWKHFGSWFTVVDTSFIRRQNKFFTIKTLITLLIVFFAAVGFGLMMEDYLIPVIKWIIPDGRASESEIREFAIIPGMIVAWVIYLQYYRFKIARSYAKNLEDIRKKLHKILHRPRKLDLSFKYLPMFCYDNTWKLAVSEFIKNSKVILMDLRGFNEKRKGCEYEIDFLLDTFPINQILFLADAKNDRSFIQKTILERWEFLREHSPNIRLDNPTARIFVSETQDETDVQSIIDLLIVSIDASK